MNTTRNKYLTEAMGGKVRTVTPKKRKFNRVGGFAFMDFVCSCCDGPQSACGNYATDFSTWESFGKLKEFSEKQNWWGEFVIDGKDSDGSYIFFSVKSGAYLHTEDINPDRFADSLYEFLITQT